MDRTTQQARQQAGGCVRRPAGPAWPASNVTLLGDKLIAVQRGESELLSAIGDYETQMRDYGFAAVKLSLRNAKQAASGNRFGRLAFKTMLPTTNALPPLKRYFARRIGS